MSLSKYTDDERYHIWGGEGNLDSLKVETVKKAVRTFVGWSDSYRLKLTDVDPSKIEVTKLPKVGRSLVLKGVGVNASVGKSPVTLGTSVTFEVQEGSVRYSRDTKFHEMITTSLTAPILLYEPDEQRGWLIPQFSVLECMTLVNISEYGLSAALPKADLDLKVIREKLLKHLKSPKLKLQLNNPDKEEADKSTFRLKELFCDLAQGLEWAEEHARRQHKLRFREKIYGLELYKLALRDKDHHVKECRIDNTHGGWVKLLDKEVIKGVVFYKGLGDVIVCDSASKRCSRCSSIPQGYSYLAALISCLEHLTKHDNLPGRTCWKLQSATFDPCYNQCCSSPERLLHNMADSSKLGS
jgi:hypothetical protein